MEDYEKREEKKLKEEKEEKYNMHASERHGK